ncbi:MAG: hypothetical protein EOS11_28815 [Mesorhizobium sp.]|uniref:hypothetical protein n=1 Tax=Mesorhizobium sp. TaxID=1871066 RepID=UPI000FE2C9C9|nr:hypothetical protein [Mesorhizobium sp.]RWO23336.1 MAG: hypothetical protein EOS09_17065 [Mesorhizobium sp.]RWO37291.1 MAG: hypothetical protein EOS11_28815 [Mesorhizobium sp.]
MEYHLGQLVACIDDRFKFTAECPAGMMMPRKGTVYRIRTLDFFRARGRSLPFLRLQEIVNPPFQSIIGPYEPVFEASAFLPLDPRRLDVFRQHVAPIKRVEGVPA